MDDSTYDIVAKLDHAFMPEDATRKQLSEATVLALQALLTDRFQLKFHHETKEMPAFVLTTIRGRFHLPPVERGDHCGTSSNGDARGTKFTGKCLSMADFATFAANRLDLPVGRNQAPNGPALNRGRAHAQRSLAGKYRDDSQHHQRAQHDPGAIFARRWMPVRIMICGQMIIFQGTTRTTVSN